MLPPNGHLLFLRRRSRQEHLPPQPNHTSRLTSTAPQHTRQEPHTVDTLLVKEGFMICPFDNPPFPVFRISPIGNIYSEILRIKEAHNRPVFSTRLSHPSINSVIPSPDFSMQYANIDHAITLIRSAGR
ncbi:hypothetical protein NQZ68_026414 [Dissostichus eleginoides]|nr:hypothetical protein NQZ68_026414 [Dissostichus eleginoides]